MPRSTAVAKDKQGTPHTYAGVALAYIFSKAGVTTGPQLRGKNLAKYVLVTCADGYQVVFSLGEVTPDVHDGTVIVADTLDGKPLADKGPFQLVVSGEKRPARWVRNLVAIRVMTAE